MFSVYVVAENSACLGIFLTRFSAHFVMMFKIQNFEIIAVYFILVFGFKV
jgi:hypothetical protein